jgi:hypothetical protein
MKGNEPILDPYADREQVLYINELHGKIAAAEIRYDRLRRKYADLVRLFVKTVGAKRYRELIATLPPGGEERSDGRRT